MMNSYDRLDTLLESNSFGHKLRKKVLDIMKSAAPKGAVGYLDDDGSFLAVSTRERTKDMPRNKANMDGIGFSFYDDKDGEGGLMIAIVTTGKKRKKYMKQIRKATEAKAFMSKMLPMLKEDEDHIDESWFDEVTEWEESDELEEEELEESLGSDLLMKFIDPKDVRETFKDVPMDTYRLFRKCMAELKGALDLPRNQEAALNKAANLVRKGKRQSPEMVMNQVMKIADLLSIKEHVESIGSGKFRVGDRVKYSRKMIDRAVRAQRKHGMGRDELADFKRNLKLARGKIVEEEDGPRYEYVVEWDPSPMPSKAPSPYLERVSSDDLEKA